MEVSEGKHKLSREEAADIVTSAMKKVSTKNLKNRYVKKSFEIWGSNTWSYDLVNFEEHLVSLSENNIYKALLRNNNGID